MKIKNWDIVYWYENPVEIVTIFPITALYKWYTIRLFPEEIKKNPFKKKVPPKKKELTNKQQMKRDEYEVIRMQNDFLNGWF